MLSTPEIQASLDVRNYKFIRQVLKDAEAADIGEAFSDMNLEQSVVLFRLIPKARRAEVFSYLDFERQQELLEELPEIVVTAVVNDMEADDRTRLLEELPFEIRSKILLRLSPEERRKAWQLLSYPEGSVGRLMTSEFLAVNADLKVSQAVEVIRWNAQDFAEELLNYVLVKDGEGKYLGELSLARLVTADPPSQKLRELITSSFVALNVADDQSVAVDNFRKYDRYFLPVVDDDNVLRGIVTADDVFDVAEDEATEDIHQFGGQATLEDSYFQTPLMTLFRKRAGWLALLFVGGLTTAALLRSYEEITQSIAWLVFFLPLIVSSGGNTGSQAASLIIRGIAIREMEVRDWYKVLGREVAVCVALGAVLGTLGYIRAVTWGLGQVIGGIVAATLVFIVIFGGVCGAMLPFFFKRVNLDPAVSSSPLLASLVDLFGVLIFYNVAVYVLSLLGGGG